MNDNYWKYLMINLLSVIIPLYNEEKRVSDGVKTVYSCLKDKPYASEIILVDDGSSDRTKDIIRGIAEQYPGVQIAKNEKNMGKGAAVKNGALFAKGDVILFTDIDLSVPISHIDAFIERIGQGYDVAIGSRRIKGSKIVVHQPFLREFMGRAYTFISNVVLGTHFSDHTCGMKAFKKEAARDLFTRQILERWAFDSEILYLSKKLGYKVAEVPVSWQDRAGTKVRKLKDAIVSFMEILKVRFHHRGKINK